MSNKATLKALLEQNNYVLSRKQLTQHNFSGQQIQNYLQSNELVKLDRGIYGSYDQLEDPYRVAQLRFKKGIISLASALYLYDLSDRIPEKIDLTVPQGYKSNTSQGIAIFHQQKKEIYKLEIETVATLQGNHVRAYSLDRTIAEVMRPVNHVDREIAVNAIKQYVRLPNKNLHKLIEFAEIFHTLDIIQTYLEVLL